MKDPLAQISDQMIARYSKRYKEMGYHVGTLGWGSREQQEFRFLQTLDGINFSPTKIVLDIGCGFGDYAALLKAQEKSFGKYVGWDINPDLIKEANGIWNKNESDISFEVKNIGLYEAESSVADIGVMLGLLNLNLKDKIDNYEYSFRFIKNAFQCVREVLVVDFLSTNLSPTYPAEDFVFYHDPVRMLKFAFSLSNNVVLKHNYSEIPQKEFMLFIYK